MPAETSLLALAGVAVEPLSGCFADERGDGDVAGRRSDAQLVEQLGVHPHRDGAGLSRGGVGAITYFLEYSKRMTKTRSAQAGCTLRRVLEESGVTKTALCTRAGISRALFDDYLHGRKQPSLAQIERIADAAGLRATVALSKKPRPVSAEYIAVMELADQLAGTQSGRPDLAFPYQVWRTGSRKVAAR